MEKILFVKELRDWDVAAKELLDFCTNEKVFATYSEMGAGKTTFIQSICKVLGVKEKVVSPTFSLVNEYHLSGSVLNRAKLIYHFDLYRLKNFEELLAIGFTEYLDSGNYCFIEWAEMAKSILPEKTVKIFIELLSGEERKIKIEKHG